LNHSFVQVSNSTLCGKCHYDFFSHSEYAICDSCNMTAGVEPISTVNGKTLLLCDNCTLLEQNAIKNEIIEQKTAEEKNSEIIKKLKDIIKYDETLTTSAQFFNAGTIACVELKKIIDSDDEIPVSEKHFKLTELIKARYSNNKKILFSAKQIEIETTSDNRAIQYFLNDLASKLSKEESERLHLANIDYVPVVAPKSVPKVKMTNDEKLAQIYAKGMKIPIEQARVLVKSGLKDMGVSCTCVETPGLCKLHGV
jgi:hypothetical protein